MISSEEYRFIKQEIRKQVMNMILTAQAGNNTNLTQSVENQYADMPTLNDRPVMFPWGLVSRCPPKTGMMTAKLGDHPGNRTVLGHLDADRPDCPALGTVLYNEFGAQITLDNNEITIGSPDADEPLVLGNVFLDFMNSVIAAIEAITVTCTAPGNPSSPPLNIAQFEALKAQYLTLKTIVSDNVFTQKLITPRV